MNRHWNGFEAFDLREEGPQFSDATPRSEVTLTPATSIHAVAIHWLWPGWLAAGKLHILGGQPGTGKSTLAVLIAAIVTTGGRWPDGSVALSGNVIIWSGEDDPADTLLPRLIASGADRSRVFFVTGVQEGKEKRAFDPAKDMLALRATIAAIKNVRLIIVDPIVSAVQGDSHKNAETRRGLAPLVELASHIGAALIGITHFSKGTSGREPIERITGSLAFGALARIVMIAAKESDGEDGEGRRIFARAKSNIGPDEGGFAYRLEQVRMPGDDRITASIATFGEAIEGSARDMLAVAEAEADEAHGSALADAEAFLLDLLLDGPLPAKKVQAAAREGAHSWRTIERAKDRLGVVSRKDGETGKWVWAANTPDQHRQDRQSAERQDRQAEPSQTLENIEDRQDRQQKRVGDLGSTPPPQNLGGLGGLGGLAPETEEVEL